MEMSFHLFGIPVDKLLKKRQKKKSDSENTKNTKNTSKKSKSGTKNSRSEAVNSKNEEHESEAKLLNDSADQGVNSTENHTKINENEESIGQDQHKPDNESENTETVTNENKIQPEVQLQRRFQNRKRFLLKEYMTEFEIYSKEFGQNCKIFAGHSRKSKIICPGGNLFSNIRE